MRKYNGDYKNFYRWTLYSLLWSKLPYWSGSQIRVDNDWIQSLSSREKENVSRSDPQDKKFVFVKSLFDTIFDSRIEEKKSDPNQSFFSQKKIWSGIENQQRIRINNHASAFCRIRDIPFLLLTIFLYLIFSIFWLTSLSEPFISILWDDMIYI